MADNHDGEYQYPLDTTGRAASNLVTGERQTINPGGFMDYYVLIPKATPFYKNDFKIRRYPSGEELQPGVHYGFSHLFMSALESIGVGVYGSITFYDHTLQGSVELEYQTLGGSWTLSEQEIANILANIIVDPRITSWEQVTGMPDIFPPIDHEHDINDFYGADDIVEVLSQIREILENSSDSALQAHIADKENPHQTTKAHVGLGQVQNFAISSEQDASSARNDLYMTPLRTRQAMQSFITPLLNAHIDNLNNPHGTTKAHVGLNLVQNYAISDRNSAEQGVRNDLYMTPLMTGFQITALALVPLQAHLDDDNNPHGTTKSHVGLGSVENYPPAIRAESELGQANDRYMTPVQTTYLFDALYLPLIRDHINDKDNPHETTKAHVGLGSVENYPPSTDAQAVGGVDNSSYMTPLRTAQALAAGQAGDAFRVFGRNEAQTRQWIESFTVTNANNVYGMNLAQLTSQILSGTASNANAINGHTWEDIEALVSGAGSAGDPARHDIPRIRGDENSNVAPESWTMFATIPKVLPQGEFGKDDLVMLIQGGIVEVTDGLPVQRLSMVFSTDIDDLTGATVIDIGYASLRAENDSPALEIGYRNGQDLEGNDVIELWTRDPELRGQVSFFIESVATVDWVDVLPNSTLTELTLAEPADLTYIDREEIGPNVADLEHTLITGFSDMAAAIAAI